MRFLFRVSPCHFVDKNPVPSVLYPVHPVYYICIFSVSLCVLCGSKILSHEAQRRKAARLSAVCHAAVPSDAAKRFAVAVIDADGEPEGCADAGFCAAEL